MKVNNFGELLNYIRNVVIDQPTEELEGDDLRIDIYDNEVSFTINELYDGPTIVYNPSFNNKYEITFKKAEPAIGGAGVGDVMINVDQVRVAGAVIAALKENEDILNKFLNREE